MTTGDSEKRIHAIKAMVFGLSVLKSSLQNQTVEIADKQHLDKLFDAVDENGNDKISLKEIEKIADKEQQGAFKKMFVDLQGIIAYKAASLYNPNLITRAEFHKNVTDYAKEKGVDSVSPTDIDLTIKYFQNIVEQSSAR